MSNIVRLDDPAVPSASTLVGLLVYGMQGGETVKVNPSLLKSQDAVDGVNGKSAYQIAIENGFVGTPAQWLDSLVGLSAYEDWKARGNTGTFEDFLGSIVEEVNILIPQELTPEQQTQARQNIGTVTTVAVSDTKEYRTVEI